MNTRFLLIIGCGMAGAGVGAAYKAWRDPSWVASGREGAMNFSETTLAPTTAATSQSPQARANPVVPPLPRPSLDDVKATAPDDRMRLLVRWLPEATADEVAALAEAWFSKDAGSGDVTWQVLAARWAELDPAAAMAFARKISAAALDSFGSNSFGGTYTTPAHYLYRALGKLNPDLALAFLAEEPPREFKNLLGEIHNMVGEEKARAWALTLPERKELDFLSKEKIASGNIDLSDPAKAAASLGDEMIKYNAPLVAQEWAKKDPAAALAWARGLASPTARAEALAAIARTLAASDPAQAAAVLETMPPQLARAKAEAAYVAALAKTDPQAALAHAQEKMNGVARLQAIAGIAAEQAKTDPSSALKLLREHGVGDFNSAGLLRSEVKGPGRSSSGYGGSSVDRLPEALKAIATKDPAGVMQLLAETGSIRPSRDWQRGGSDSESNDGYLARSLFNQWVTQDVAAAAQWAGSQAGDAAMKDFVQNAASRWYAQDPAAVQAFASGLPSGPARDGFIMETARLMAADDVVGALTWAGQSGGEQAVGATFRALAEATPEVAAGYFTTLPPSQQTEQLQALADSLGKRTPAAAVEFFNSLPADQQAAVKLYDTTIAYAKQDAQAASAWITTLPETKAKDTAISGLVDYLIKESSDPDPEAAAYWAAASVDPGGRDRQLKRVAEAWFQRDPVGARTAIEATTLALATKQKLLSHEPAAR